MWRGAILAVALLASAQSLTGQQPERTDAAALAHRLEAVVPRFLEVATHFPAREAARVNPLLLLRDDG